MIVHVRRSLSGVIAIALLLVMIARPSDAETCKASARIQLRATAGLTCPTALRFGEPTDYEVVLTNDSSVVIGPGIPSRKVAARLVNTCQGGVNAGVRCASDDDCGSFVCAAAVTFTLACILESCALELPGTLTFVSQQSNGCVQSADHVVSCAHSPADITGNRIDVRVDADGVALPPGGIQAIAKIRLLATAEVPFTPGIPCGRFASRIDTASFAIVTDDPTCENAIASSTGGDGAIVFLPQPSPTPTPFPFP